MAITFDPTNRIVLLDSFTVSASQIWSRWVDWVAIGDNIKYEPAMYQIGGVAPVALYLYLQNGWRVRPVEANGVTTITGNLLVDGGGSPIAPTIGAFQVLVNLETPVSAQALEVAAGSLTGQNIADIAAAVEASLADDFAAVGSTGNLPDLVQSIKDKTDQMRFTKANELDVNQKSINDAKVYGTGTDSNRWRGTP